MKKKIYKTYFDSLLVEQWLGLRDKLFKLTPPVVVVEDVDVLRWFVSACPWRGDIGVDGADRIPKPMLLVDLQKKENKINHLWIMYI